MLSRFQQQYLLSSIEKKKETGLEECDKTLALESVKWNGK